MSICQKSNLFVDIFWENYGSNKRAIWLVASILGHKNFGRHYICVQY